jgi:hypothetical protein
VAGGGGGGVGSVGGLVSGRMHDAMSNSMNSRIFSCGDRLVVVQPLGNEVFTLSPFDTWMSL